MDNAPLDRRARRTRRMLREALFALILEKGYDTVTIEDITRRADLGRTTFYLHYRDKEELLLQCMDETANELAVQIVGLPPAGAAHKGGRLQLELNTPSPVLAVFQHAAQNAAIYRIILRGEGAYKATRRIREITSHYAAGFLSQRLADEEGKLNLAVPLEVIANYFAGSLLGMLTWWLENGTPYSAEEMTEMFRRLLFLGLQGVTSNHS